MVKADMLIRFFKGHRESTVSRISCTIKSTES